MANLDEKFASTFAHVRTSENPSTQEQTKDTLYVKPSGSVTKDKPLDFNAQGNAIARQKQKNTPKNTKSAYTPKTIEFMGFCRSLYGKEPEDQLVTPEKLFGFLYYQAHRAKFTSKRG